VQGALVLRTILYWTLCMFTIAAALLVWRVFAGTVRTFDTPAEGLWFHYGPVFVAALLLLPLVVVDIVRLSNRFAGPVFRLRRVLHEAAQGEHVEPIHFRKGDYWHDIATDFNQLLARLEAAERRAGVERELVGAGGQDG
jgi:hypothetical protein